MTKAAISEAQRKIESGKFREAYEVLRPLLETEVPDALFLYSTFSLAGTESEAEFEKRSFELLERAADLGHAPALYALGVCYEVGDLVEANPIYAATLLKAAAEMGHAKAKFCHGLNLYHGSNGVPRSEGAGLALVRAAAQDGVEDAEEFLKDQGIG
ncbi:tetratricopeptide repeat protein [Roseateles sp. BYS180W]|uniref:Tetratricopeptide repeat protein n=1 Tax=Roseateles rivi TaxID=3299028 RepID=A0ABW7FX87_9BURK